MEIYDQLIYVQAHCDSRVLHGPGHCKYCDKYPEAQSRRAELGVCFTGEVNDGSKIDCPAVAVRGLDSINGWGGNQPHGPGVTDEEKQHLKNIERFSSKVMYGENHQEEF